MPDKFAGKLERSTRRSRGRTTVESTPIAIRSNVPVSPRLESRIRTRLARRIGHAAPLIERGTVRFEDVNGPRGGVDTVCRIKLVISGRPSVQAEERASDVEPAFDLAAQKVQRALKRMRGKHGLAAGRQRGNGTSKRAATVTASSRAHRREDQGGGEEMKKQGKKQGKTHQMKLKTARRPPSRKAVKVKARQAKHRVGVKRGGGKRR